MPNRRYRPKVTHTRGRGVIKQTIEISRQAVHLSCRQGQLIVQPCDADRSAATSIACEDIGVVLIDHPAVTVTHRALSTLAAHGATVVICGQNHLPAGMLAPISTHSEVVGRVHEQINATKPAKKRIWQQLVTAKIKAQARNLPEDSPVRLALDNIASEVRSGDPGNAEGHAARLYWSAWLDPSGGAGLQSSLTAEATMARTAASFKRDQDGLDPLNAMLNYGYAVLRAAVSRAIVSAGFVPSLGVHHHHRRNAFALADDLIEPLRPLVDARVRQLHHLGRGQDGLDQPTKASLLSLLTHPVQTGRTGPLAVALHRTTASLLDGYRSPRAKLVLPVWSQVQPCT